MKKNDILVFLIPTLLIVVLWVIFNIYHSFITSTIPSTLNVSIKPISPDFDEKTISDLKSRSSVSPSYQLNEDSIAELELQPTPPIASTQSAQASPGGSLL
ncbi:MAG: hypothetical protein A2798_00860 [Candidatus Levybacteria bacterium RIFCSPHIGHO2_01_FULL_37_17]|nr:MAG: hypothetical protein A2798_00860 [Candidatus Levybacteria bacterium RIFCSPHIGHO2_01_FULL_37_17]OGH37001.1 MAG: hypothetical protein A2959_01720 [Candidatus Levybacteria bacterium RIFCSPLOWO2_01_FULL_38_23]